MENKIEIKDGYTRVEGENFIADVDENFALVCLEQYTFLLRPNQLANMESVLEIAKQYWEKAGVK